MNTSRNAWIATYVFFSVFLLLLFVPLWTGSVGPIWDSHDFFYPAFTYLADSVREMRMPLWDPYTNCGYPFHADPSNMTLNPLAIMLGVLIDSPLKALIWFWILNWCWGGIGMIWLARHYGASPLGGLFAAVAYALSGFFLAHAEHLSFIVLAGWLPWIIGCSERAVIRTSIGYALLAGAAFGFSSYGGYPGLIVFTCFALPVWLVFRFAAYGGSDISSADERGAVVLRMRWVLLTLAVTYIVLVVIWSPTLHAFLVEGRGYTERVNQLSVQRATTNEPFTFYSLISMFYPYATFTGKVWMGADISMTNAYMGTLTIPFALFWVWKKGLRRTWWLLFFIAIMFVISLGGKYGLRTLLYYLYPPSRFIQYNAPFRLFWIFPFCIAAGLGFSSLVQHRDGQSALFRIVLLWAIVAAGVAAIFISISHARGINWQPDGHQLFTSGAVLLAVSALCIWRWEVKGTGLLSRFAPVILLTVLLVDMSIHLHNNAGTVWDESNQAKLVEGFHRTSTRYLGNPPPRMAGRPYGYMNAQQIIKTPLVQGYLTMLSASFDNVLCKGKFVEVLSAPFRFWLTPGVEVATSNERALQELAASGINDVVPVFVEHQIASLPLTRTVPGNFGVVTVVSYTPERIEVVADVPGTYGALLTSTERYTPGWRVTVDGVLQQSLKTNLFFRGVQVPAGRHRVVWYYQPEWWLILAGVSYVVLILAFIVGIISVKRRQTAIVGNEE